MIASFLPKSKVEPLFRFFCLVFALSFVSPIAFAGIDIVWEPLLSTAHVNEPYPIAMYYETDGQYQSLAQAVVVLQWTGEAELLRETSGGESNWIDAGFTLFGQPHVYGVNEDMTDGDALFVNIPTPGNDPFFTNGRIFAGIFSIVPKQTGTLNVKVIPASTRFSYQKTLFVEGLNLYVVVGDLPELNIAVSSGSSGSVCGNGVVDAGEACDGTALALNGLSCVGNGFDGGDVRCTPACTHDFSACFNVPDDDPANPGRYPAGHPNAGAAFYDPATLCGDGIRQTYFYEVCDSDTLLGQTTCGSFAQFSGGTLKCAATCLAYDTSSCIPIQAAVCGNNILEATETCDGSALNNQTCQTQGFDLGTLGCAQNCMSFDVSACQNNPPLCGNNQTEEGEICDGTDLSNTTCWSLDFDGGTLSCATNCASFDTSECQTTPAPMCGNNVRESGEACDGTALNSQTCQSLGFDTGTLSCNPNCLAFNTTNCSGEPPLNANATIDISLATPASTIVVGQPVRIDVMYFCDEDTPLEACKIVASNFEINWDPAQITYVDDELSTDYSWMISMHPNVGEPGLNADLLDGDFTYVLLAPFGPDKPQANPQGLRGVSFWFTPTVEGTITLDIARASASGTNLVPDRTRTITGLTLTVSPSTVPPASVCGDAVCDATETSTSCPQDCTSAQPPTPPRTPIVSDILDLLTGLFRGIGSLFGFR